MEGGIKGDQEEEEYVPNTQQAISMIYDIEGDNEEKHLSKTQ